MATLREYKVVQDIDLSENILKRVSEIQAGKDNTIVISADNKAEDVASRKKYSVYIDSQLFKLGKSKFEFEKDNTDKIVETFTDYIAIQDNGIKLVTDNDRDNSKIEIDSKSIILGNAKDSNLLLTSRVISTKDVASIRIGAGSSIDIFQPSDKEEPFIHAERGTTSIKVNDLTARNASFNTCNTESLKIVQENQETQRTQGFTIRWDEGTKSIIFEIL